MKCSDCSAKIRPVVCVDIDGTLAQYHEALANFIDQWLPGDRAPHSWDGLGEFNDHLGIDKETYRQAKLAFRAGGFKRWMEPFKGAVGFMQMLSREDLEIWVTTTRPWQRMDNVDPDTKEWLRRYDIPYKHLLFDEDKYGCITELIDPDRILMVLDDEAEQYERCQELGLPFVLKRTSWNHGVNVGCNWVANFDEAFKLIQERRGIKSALHII